MEILVRESQLDLVQVLVAGAQWANAKILCLEGSKTRRAHPMGGLQHQAVLKNDESSGWITGEQARMDLFASIERLDIAPGKVLMPWKQLPSCSREGVEVVHLSRAEAQISGDLFGHRGHRHERELSIPQP